MKKILLLLATAGLTGSLLLGQSNPVKVYGPFEPVVIPAFYKAPKQWGPQFLVEERLDLKNRVFPAITHDTPPPHYDDPVRQIGFSTRTPQVLPFVNVEGVGFNGIQPPDPVGAIGPNHYVQAINGFDGTSYYIFNNDGSLAGGPFVFDNITPGLPGSGAGDPIVLFDELAGKWVFTEFGNNNDLRVYISQTDNPLTTTWYSYRFITADFPDYPKYAVWPTAYFIGTNESSNPPVYAMDRTKMLAGQPATIQRIEAPSSLGAFGFQMITPTDFDGVNPPPPGSPCYFFRHRDDEAHNPGNNNPNEDYVEIFAFDVDFTTPANSSFTLSQTIPVAEFDSELCGFTSFSCMKQPGSFWELDPLREVFMFRMQYLNFGTHEVIVGNHVTDVTGTDIGGIRWYEFRKTGSNPWAVHQQGTFAPDNKSRWMGSISMDLAGNIALGYSLGGATLFPTLAYTGRLANDPLGQMTLDEVIFAPGQSSHIGERWGDYACMTVDPTNWKRFWFTGEYMKANNEWGTKVVAFEFTQDSLDMALNGLIGLETPVCTDSITLGIRYRNIGIDTVKNVQIGYSLNGAPPIITTLNDTLITNGQDTLFVPLANLINGSNSLIIFSQSPNNDIDDNRLNDTIRFNFVASYQLSVNATLLSDILCYNQNNGSIQATTPTGVGPFTYRITGNSNYQNNTTFNGLAAGTYTVEIRDVNGCTASAPASITLTNPAQIVVNLTKTDNSGAGINDGTITASATGGTGQFEYSLNNGPYSSNAVFTNLAPGVYAVTARDENGCTRAKTISIGTVGIDVNPLQSSLSLYPNPSTGEVQLTISAQPTLKKSKLEVFTIEGKLVYSESLDISNGILKKLDLSTLAKGTYIVKITAGPWDTTEKLIIH